MSTPPTPEHPTLTPAPAPAASPRARWWTILLGVVLLGLGAVAVHDLVVVRGSLHADPWLSPAYEWLANVHYAGWVLPAAIGSLILALVLFLATVRPRTRTHLTFVTSDAIYARPVDVARLGTAAAQRIGGVSRASTVATRKRITVTAVSSAGDAAERAAVTAEVRNIVEPLAALLDPAPRLVVRVISSHNGGDRR